MVETAEVVIIGGGAAGCSVAYYLAKVGVRATIVERERVASQASGFSAGGLNPLQGAGIPGPLASLAMDSFRKHLDTWEELIEQSGVDFHPQLIYAVNVAFQESDMPELEDTFRIFESADGFSADWMDAAEVLELEPRLSSDVLRGLRTYGNAALDSHLYTLALSKAAEGLGATIRYGSATALISSGQRVTGVLLEDGELSCENVVIATGPWSGDASQWLGTPIPIEPLKGEILRMRLDGAPLPHDFSGAEVSLYRRSDGLAWVGATEERRGFDRQPSDAVRRLLVEKAARLVPTMAKAALVEHTACLRPVTPDWLPIIGKAPGWQNAYLATGAGKKGILLSPAIGKAVADLITYGASSLDLTPFAPERFAAAPS